MGVPATTGVLRENLSDMEIGDYILCYYSYHGLGVLSAYSGGLLWGLGSTAGPRELSLSGNGASPGNYSHFFYFVKVAKGILVADRVCQHTITWNTLNTGKAIEGIEHKFNGSDSAIGNKDVKGYIRSLSGGVSRADDKGNMSLVDNGYGGWPSNNEWERYIVNFPADLIQIGMQLDDVFHWRNVATWCQDTPVLGISNSGNRTWRGLSVSNFFGGGVSNYSGATLGFRPVFEYGEV